MADRWLRLVLWVLNRLATRHKEEMSRRHLLDDVLLARRILARAAAGRRDLIPVAIADWKAKQA